MKKGYTEWVSTEYGISFITNPFNRVLYMNQNFPDGQYIKVDNDMKLSKIEKGKLKKGREFNKEELMLELL